MFDEHIAAHCNECGEALYDGDTAYRLDGRYYCAACVDDGLTVVREKKNGIYDYEDDETDEQVVRI